MTMFVNQRVPPVQSLFLLMKSSGCLQENIRQVLSRPVVCMDVLSFARPNRSISTGGTDKYIYIYIYSAAAGRQVLTIRVPIRVIDKKDYGFQSHKICISLYVHVCIYIIYIYIYIRIYTYIHV